MNVSGGWQLAGLIVCGWILADMLSNGPATASILGSLSSIIGTVGGQVSNKPASK
jgi:hypothetical protein